MGARAILAKAIYTVTLGFLLLSVISGVADFLDGQYLKMIDQVGFASAAAIIGAGIATRLGVTPKDLARSVLRSIRTLEN